jgi:pyruvate,water dikinase
MDSMSDKTALTVLDNSNIVESYPGITLPLTYSFIRRAYQGVFKGVIGTNLRDDAVLVKFDDVFENMITSYKGRIYYCINNWYLLIDFMPFSKKIIPVWQDMMGVQNTEVYLGSRHNFTFGQKTKMYWNMLRTGLHVPRNMKRLEKDFIDIKKYFNETYNETLSIKELLTLFHEIEHRILDKWYVTISNDLYAFIWTGILKRQLKKKGIDAIKSISGITSLESLKPIKQLLYLAKKYGDEKDILNQPEVQEYIDIYGDRSPHELKLEVMTYREEPFRLEEQIREYASDKNKLDLMIRNLEEVSILHHQNTFAAKRARLGIENREISRLNRSRIYGMVRRIFMKIGEVLYKEGYIDQQLDIFYLELNELENSDYNEFRQKIEERKAEYEIYKKLPSHSRLVFRGEQLIDEKIAKNWTGEFMGVGTSTGDITAEAIVLDSPNGKANVKGKIIITKTTDPGWVFLLTMAGGIVAEKGSLLSHTSIISRELKIPAVVGVESATSVIKTGDIINIDGALGRVKIVQSN